MELLKDRRVLLGGGAVWSEWTVTVWSPAGMTTRAWAPKPRIQLFSGRSLQTHNRRRIEPSSRRSIAIGRSEAKRICSGANASLRMV